MPVDQESKGKLKPLKITCTSSDCENGLHCFRQTRKMMALNLQGQCRACGAELVDWKRVHKREPADVAYTFTALKYELIRHHFWHVAVDQRAENHARRKGIEEWHGIPRGRELTEDEIAYLTTLAMLYINERLPFLTLHGEKVPRMPRRSHNVSSAGTKESTHVSADRH